MKRKILFLISLFATMLVMAQYDPDVSHYYEVPSSFNPSAIGDRDYMRIGAVGRMQWVGVDGAPRTFTGVADMPFKLDDKRIGLGANVMQESIGLYKTLAASLQGAFKFKGAGGMWSIGIQAGIYDQSFNGSKVILPSDNDYHQSVDEAIPTQDVHGTAFDLGAGLWYTHPKFYAGLSATHLTAPTVTLNTASGAGGSETSDKKFEFQALPTVYFTAGGNISIQGTLFDIVPSVLVKSDFNFIGGEITGRAVYNKLLTFGLGYRLNNAVVASAGMEFKDFYVSYAFDYSLSAIGAASYGSHEVFIGYKMKLDLADKNRSRHKSVRIM